MTEINTLSHIIDLIHHNSFSVNSVIDLAQEAGSQILTVYSQDFDVREKADRSPLTTADILSHQTILEGLSKITPGVPILSEESLAYDVEERMSWKTYWLIDPLDGTKEFIERNGEFTVNIALIHKHKPVFGVVYAPALQVTYWGGVDLGAYKITEANIQKIRVRSLPINVSDWKIVGSRHHQSDGFRNFLSNYPKARVIPMGSSLKFCLVAEGVVDLYPRLGPTSEWDTAASQAIVEAAGGQVLRLPDKSPLTYNKKTNLTNPHFLACAENL